MFQFWNYKLFEDRNTIEWKENALILWYDGSQNFHFSILIIQGKFNSKKNSGVCISVYLFAKFVGSKNLKWICISNVVFLRKGVSSFP